VAVNDIIRMIEDGIGRRGQLQYEERPPADPMMTWADISRAQNILGWNPTVGIEEGIRRTVQWYMEHRDWASKLT
jgi:nucleoside-diphosphate-sugar epimerase